MSYKKIKTVLVYGKKKCIYMKPKGTRKYVKSKGEYVLLPVYLKRVAKIAAKKLIKNKNGKNKNGKKKIRGGEHESLSLKVIDVNDNRKVFDLCKTDLNTELVLLSKEKPIYMYDKYIAVRIKDEDFKAVIDVTDIDLKVRNKNVINKMPANVTKYYYKENEKSKLEEINTEVTIDYIWEWEHSAARGYKIYYYVYKKLGGDKTIYSEKGRCKLQSKDDNGSIKFNIEGVKNILFNYKPLFEKLYIYDSGGYKEIDVPEYLQSKNIRQLANHDKDSKNPVTHTRIALQTPNSHSNRVTADIVGDNNRQKSKKSMISNFVDMVTQTTRKLPTYATNDPFKDHYSIKDAYENSLQKKSISSRFKNAFSRKTTQGPLLYGRSGGSIKSLSLKK
jgi:hypothetical protein